MITTKRRPILTHLTLIRLPGVLVVHSGRD
jgi:hypothetical protein